METYFKTIDPWNISFQEIPSEITLNIPIIQCKFNCPGCSWKSLIDECKLHPNQFPDLTESLINSYLTRYMNYITCVCVYGGDFDFEKLIKILDNLRLYSAKLKIGLYSGLDIKFIKSKFFKENLFNRLDYIKLGRYIEELGGLDSPNTNQKLFKKVNNKFIDITNLFTKV